jgi:hypothetical protein
MAKITLAEAIAEGKLLRLQARTVDGWQRYLGYELGLEPWPGKIGKLNKQDNFKWSDSWENKTLQDFFEAMSAWLETYSLEPDGLQRTDIDWHAIAEFIECVLENQISEDR